MPHSGYSRNVRRKSAQNIMYPGDVPDVLDENAQGAIYDRRHGGHDYTEYG